MIQYGIRNDLRNAVKILLMYKRGQRVVDCKSLCSGEGLENDPFDDLAWDVGMRNFIETDTSDSGRRLPVSRGTYFAPFV